MDAARFALTTVTALLMAMTLAGCASRPEPVYRSPLEMIKDSDQWTEGEWHEPEADSGRAEEPIEPSHSIKAVGVPGKAPCDTRCGCLSW